MKKKMDKILISGLIATGIVGVEHPERDFPQELSINVILYYPLDKAGSSDRIEDSISYSYVAKLLRQSVQDSSFYTLEALAEHLAEQIFEQTPANALKLKIEKSNIVTKTSKVGVEIFRNRLV